MLIIKPKAIITAKGLLGRLCAPLSFQKRESPFQISGLGDNLFNEAPEKGSELLEYVFNTDLSKFFIKYYLSLLKAFEKKDETFLNSVLEKKFRDSIRFDDLVMKKSESPTHVKFL